MLQLKHSIVLLLVVSLPVLDCRKSSGGGGRGFSAGRQQASMGGGGQPHGGGFGAQPHGGSFQQPGGFNNQPAGGFKPGGGYPPQQGGGGYPHQQPQPNYGGYRGNNGPYGGGGFNGPPHNNPGFGNSPNSHTARNALLGGLGGALLGGVATYGIMSALHRDQPIPVNGKEYYLDQNYFKGKPDEFMCSMPFDELVKPSVPAVTTTTVVPSAAGDTTTPTTTTAAPALSEAKFADGSRPKQVVWACKKNTEVCCEGKCCPAPQNQMMNNNGPIGSGSSKPSGGAGAGTIVLIILLVLLLLCCCVCLVAYKSCRAAFDWMIPSSNANTSNQGYPGGDSTYKYGDNQPYGQGPQYNQPQQNYPMQPYPQQQQYPAYPQNPTAYPPYPEPPKY